MFNLRPSREDSRPCGSWTREGWGQASPAHLINYRPGNAGWVPLSDGHHISCFIGAPQESFVQHSAGKRVGS